MDTFIMGRASYKLSESSHNTIVTIILQLLDEMRKEINVMTKSICLDLSFQTHNILFKSETLFPLSM